MSSKAKKSLLPLLMNITLEKSHKSSCLEGSLMEKVKKPAAKSKEKASKKETSKTSSTINKKIY